MKFDVGDIITSVADYHGFDDAKVLGTTEIKGKQYYILKILCGTATIPVSAEDNYKLKTNKK